MKTNISVTQAQFNALNAVPGIAFVISQLNNAEITFTISDAPAPVPAADVPVVVTAPVVNASRAFTTGQYPVNNERVAGI